MQHHRILGLVGCLVGSWAMTAIGSAPNVLVTDVWSRATAPGATTGVVYLALTNNSDSEDRLLKLRASIARQVELHQTFEAHGLMTMRQLPALVLAPHAHVAAAPGAIHIMLLGLQHALIAGSTFELVLEFEHAAPVTITVTVKAGE